MKRIIYFFLFAFHFISCEAQVSEKLIVYFRFDDFTLDFNSKNKIDSILRSAIIGEVDIEAHCDSFGSHNYNDALSSKRALGVKQYMISKGLNESQMSLRASGKRFPLNKNENETARALNRRAEISFVIKNTEVSHEDTTILIAKKVDSLNRGDTLSKDSSTININEVEVGSTFRLENLNFIGGRHKLLPQSQKTLEQLLNALKANPTLVIEIQGHICCMEKGDGADFDTGTMNLSVNRAKTIYDYLVKNGIDPKRLSYRGFGSSHKLVEEITEQDMSTNRRVEIKVIKK